MPYYTFVNMIAKKIAKKNYEGTFPFGITNHAKKHTVFDRQHESSLAYDLLGMPHYIACEQDLSRQEMIDEEILNRILPKM
jgi:hypothetical protein